MKLSLKKCHWGGREFAWFSGTGTYSEEKCLLLSLPFFSSAFIHVLPTGETDGFWWKNKLFQNKNVDQRQKDLNQQGISASKKEWKLMHYWRRKPFCSVGGTEDKSLLLFKMSVHFTPKTFRAAFSSISIKEITTHAKYTLVFTKQIQAF